MTRDITDQLLAGFGELVRHHGVDLGTSSRSSNRESADAFIEAHLPAEPSDNETLLAMGDFSHRIAG